MVVLAVVLTASPKTPRPSVSGPLRNPRSLVVTILGPVGTLATPAAAIGVSNTLSPLRMAELEADHEFVAVVFLAAGAAGVVIGSASGGWIDRGYRRRVIVTGLAFGILSTAGLTISGSRIADASALIVHPRCCCQSAGRCRNWGAAGLAGPGHRSPLCPNDLIADHLCGVRDHWGIRHAVLDASGRTVTFRVPLANVRDYCGVPDSKRTCAVGSRVAELLGSSSRCKGVRARQDLARVGTYTWVRSPRN